MTFLELTAVIRAASAGKTIQFRPLSYSAFGPEFGWEDVPDVQAFNWSGAEYRIKPA